MCQVYHCCDCLVGDKIEFSPVQYFLLQIPLSLHQLSNALPYHSNNKHDLQTFMTLCKLHTGLLALTAGMGVVRWKGRMEMFGEKVGGMLTVW